MKSILKPLLFIGSILAVIVYSSGCKKCIICTVKDVNSGKVLYITPEKCGKEADFKTLQDSVTAAFNCWACAVYDTTIYDSLKASALAVRLNSSYKYSMDSLAVDSLDSVKCGSLKKLELIRHNSSLLVRLLKQNPKLFVYCNKDKYPNKSECD